MPDDDPADEPTLAFDGMLGAVLDGRYAIRRRIGEGMMGIVYEATQLSVERPVAIKVIRDSLHHEPSATKRFLREATLLTGINHPNVVQVFDVGQTPTGAPYLVTELLVGRTLADELRVVGRLDARSACALAIQLCDALAAAHERGIVHRDLKPANIVLLDAPAVRDLVKVLDFGLAKSLSTDTSTPVTTLTETGVLLGTPLYMAPESMGSSTLDPRSDLYSLGCVLYELVAGAPPFADTAVHRVLARHLSEPPPPLPAHVPDVLADVVMALLAKSPDARPPSAVSVRSWLEAVAASLANPEPDDVPTLPHQPRLDRAISQRATVRELPPPPNRSPTRSPQRLAPPAAAARPRVHRAIPVVVLSVSLLAFAAAVALLIHQLAT